MTTNRPAGPGQVVVGVSANLAGLHALRYAVAEARRHGAVLHAVRACGFSPAWTGPDVERIRAELRVEAQRQTLAAFDDAMGGVPGDLVVLELPGRRRSSWLFKACARHAGCPVVDDVSLRVAPGEIYALLGFNGAGKSTSSACCWAWSDRHGDR